VRAKRPEVEAFLGLATAYGDLARTERATRCANLAHAIGRRTGYRVLEGLALTCLAGIARSPPTTTAPPYVMPRKPWPSTSGRDTAWDRPTPT
jgi:hypothetical protein